MRASELQEMSSGDLREKERELREEVFRLGLRRGTGQLENPMRVRLVRRDLARVLTVMRAKREGA